MHAPGKPGNRDADDGAVPRDQGTAIRIRCCSTGWGISTSCSSRTRNRIEGARHHADQARQASGPGYPDVRRAGACGRRLSAEADRARASASRSASRLEDPAEAKKARLEIGGRRDVTRLVTPGTITEEKLLDPSQSSNFLAIGADKGAAGGTRAGLDRHLHRPVPCRRKRAWNGCCRTSCVSDRVKSPWRKAYSTTSFAPLRPARTFGTPLPASCFDSATAENRLARFYGVGDARRVRQFLRAELAAAGGAIAYVERRRFPSGRRCSGRSAKAGARLFIDPATRANLEIERTLSGARQGSLLKAIDRTVTGGGGPLLADMAALAADRLRAINRRGSTVSYFLIRRRPTLRRPAAGAQGRGRHAAGAVAALAQPWRPARSRRHPRRAGSGRDARRSLALIRFRGKRKRICDRGSMHPAAFPAKRARGAERSMTSCR
jgi:hypothetical protein